MVRVVFASVAMGMGIDLRGVNTIIHYGAPSSIEDYFQASGRGGRSGDSAYSIVYWTPKDCPLRKDPATTHHREVNDVRRYLENSSVCRRKWLLEYFDPTSAKPGDDPMVCCDVCAANQPTPASDFSWMDNVDWDSIDAMKTHQPSDFSWMDNVDWDSVDPPDISSANSIPPSVIP